MFNSRVESQPSQIHKPNSLGHPFKVLGRFSIRQGGKCMMELVSHTSAKIREKKTLVQLFRRTHDFDWLLAMASYSWSLLGSVANAKSLPLCGDGSLDDLPTGWWTGWCKPKLLGHSFLHHSALKRPPLAWGMCFLSKEYQPKLNHAYAHLHTTVTYLRVLVMSLQKNESTSSRNQPALRSRPFPAPNDPLSPGTQAQPCLAHSARSRCSSQLSRSTWCFHGFGCQFSAPYHLTQIEVMVALADISIFQHRSESSAL